MWRPECLGLVVFRIQQARREFESNRMMDKSSHQTSPVFHAISLGPSSNEYHVTNMTDMTMTHIINMIDITNEQGAIRLLPTATMLSREFHLALCFNSVILAARTWKFIATKENGGV